MRLKLLWIITALLLAAFLILEMGIIQGIDLSDGFGLIKFILDLVANLVLVFSIGALLGAVIAVIPYKQWNYGKKFSKTLPFASSLVLVILLFSFGQIAYLEKVKGIKVGPLVEYDSVETSTMLDCSSIRNGQFETEAVRIMRWGDKQTEVRKESQEEKEFYVAWQSDCEYTLTPLDNPEITLKVKIISVEPGEYSCYVAKDKYAQRMTIKRVQNDSSYAL